MAFRPQAALYVAAAGLVCAVMTRDGAAHPQLTAATWDDVGPILAESCVGCHKPGGSALPSLVNYDEARAVAPAIKRSVLERRMPPWRAAPGFGDFANDPTLTAAQMELVASWADGGARPAASGTPVALDTDTNTHPPDMVLRPAAEHPISGPQQRFELPIKDEEERWLRGWHFRPGNAAAVTQAEISMASGGALGTWVPPEGPVFLPENTAYRLPRGATFLVDVRYRRMSAAAVDRSELALYFSRRPRHEARHLSVPCGSTQAAHDLDVLSIQPALGAFGDAIEIVATRPDGRVELLGWFRNYPPGYRATYRFRAPVRLPKATRIDVRSKDQTCTADLEYVESPN